MRLYLKKHIAKIGLVEWLKVKALSSSPSTTQTKTSDYKQCIAVSSTLLRVGFKCPYHKKR
jgi:hypothetical protein